MKLKTLLNRIDVLNKEGKISSKKSKDFKEIVNMIWISKFEKHHLSGSKDGTYKNKVKIKGCLHYMLHTYAYKFIVKRGLLKIYLKWLNKTFGAEVKDLLLKLKESEEV